MPSTSLVQNTLLPTYPLTTISPPLTPPPSALPIQQIKIKEIAYKRMLIPSAFSEKKQLKFVNLPMSRWKEAERPKNIPKEIFNSKWESRKSLRMEKLKSHGIPVSDHELDLLLDAIKILKSELKQKEDELALHSLPKAEYPKFYQIKINEKPNQSIFQVAVFDREDGKGKDILLIDKNWFVKGGYKFLYPSWLLTKNPTRVVCAISSLNSSEDLKIALNEAHYLERFNFSQSTPTLFKIAYIETKRGPEQMIWMKHYPHCLFDLLADIQKNDRMSQKEKLHLALEISKVFKFLNDQHCLHRDPKPDNVLLDENRQPIVCDFGFACNDSDSELNDKATGTLNYTPYEDLFSSDSASDLLSAAIAKQTWSLGLMFYLLFYKQVPWKVNADLSNLNEVKKKMEQFHHHKLPELSPIAQLINHMLDLDPTQRPTTDQVIEKLEKMLENIPPSTSSGI